MNFIFESVLPKDLVLTESQAGEIVRRLHLGVQEAREHPSFYHSNEPTPIRLELAHNDDAFPEGDLSDRPYVAIPHGPDHHIFVFIGEDFVTTDGDLRFDMAN